MSQQDVVCGKQDGKEFRWPPSGYERLLGASAAGRQAHPPFVGSAASRYGGSDNGHDFPSLIASDAVVGGNAKVAAGDAPTNRRVRFSDEGTSLRNANGNVPRMARSGIPLKTTKCSSRPMPTKQTSRTMAVPSSVAKKPMRSAIKRQKVDEKLGDLRNPVARGARKSTDSNAIEALSAPSISIRKRSVSTSTGYRKATVSEVDCSRNGPVNVKMNNAAVKRQNHIRQRLRAEWIECHGDKKACPF